MKGNLPTHRSSDKISGLKLTHAHIGVKLGRKAPKGLKFEGETALDLYSSSRGIHARAAHTAYDIFVGGSIEFPRIILSVSIDGRLAPPIWD